MYGEEMEQMVDEDGNPVEPMEGDGQQYEYGAEDEVSESALIQI